MFEEYFIVQVTNPHQPGRVEYLACHFKDTIGDPIWRHAIRYPTKEAAAEACLFEEDQIIRVQVTLTPVCKPGASQ